MRYQNFSSFEKHLADSSPHHLCRIYLSLIPDDFERTKALDAVLAYLPISPDRYSAADCDLRACLDGVQSMSLLGESVVVLDEVEKLSKKQMEILIQALRTAGGYLILGGRSKCTSLAAAVEKEGVVLDLLEEKPWDKERRLTQQLIARAKSAGKKLSPEAAQLLLERLGADAALLESEIDKLICYVGDQTQIDRQEILAISPASKTASLWQTAEEIVWEKGEFPPLDTSAFYGLVPALRSQLHLGLVLSSLIEEKVGSEEWSAYLPKMWPKTLEKRSSQAARLGSLYFRKGLDKLFEIELISRSYSTQMRALLDLFRAQLHGR